MSKHRSYCVTINNPSEQDEVSLLALPHIYLIYQYEMGESKTIHIQAYFQFKGPLSFNTVKAALPGAHIEPARGTGGQNRAYCTKIDGRVDGPYEYGICPKPGSITSNKSAQTDALMADIKSGVSIKQICESYPTLWMRHSTSIKTTLTLFAPGRGDLNLGKPKVTVYWGLPGSGKSYSAQQEAKSIGEVFNLVKSGSNYWWDGYTGQPCVIINDFYGGYPYSEFLNLLDAYNNRVNIKGSSTPFLATHIWITSNRQPCQWYKLSVTGDWSHKFQPIKNALERRIDVIKYFDCVYVAPQNLFPSPLVINSSVSSVQL